MRLVEEIASDFGVEEVPSDVYENTNEETRMVVQARLKLEGNPEPLAGSLLPMYAVWTIMASITQLLTSSLWCTLD